MMTKEEKESVIASAKFLEEKGYNLKEFDGESAVYFGNDRQILVDFGSRGEGSSVSVRFIKENDVFDLGWIAFIRDGVKLAPGKTKDNLVALLVYLRDHYHEAADFRLCKESAQTVNAYLKEKISNKGKG